MHLSQIKDYVLREFLRLLVLRVEKLERSDEGDPILAGDTAAATDAISQGYAEEHYGSEVQRNALQVGGEFPLSVAGLRGLLADAQVMGIRVIPDTASLPPLQNSRPYEVISWQGFLYFYNPTPSPGKWVVLSAAASILAGTHVSRPLTTANQANTLYWETDRLQLYRLSGSPKTWVIMEGVSVMSGTLNPDTKPSDLGAGDTGFRFFATDYAREYRWTGAAWEDAPGAPARQQISFFNAVPEPAAGWLLCDGAGGNISTAVGATAGFTPPDLISSNYFLRSANAAGGTGGTSAHTHSVPGLSFETGTADADSEVQSGTGSNVSAHGHKHTGTTSGGTTGAASAAVLPPYYEALPYIRV